MLEKEIKEYLLQFRPEQETVRGETAAQMLMLLYNKMIKHNNIFFSRFDITSAQFDILVIIKHHDDPDGYDQAALSKKLLVTQGNITRIIDRMVRQGFVVRKTNKKDRRRNLVKLTKKGLEVFEQGFGGYQKLIEGYAKDVKEISTLTELLSKWLYSLKDLD